MQLCYVMSNQRRPPREVESTLFPGSKSYLVELYGLDAGRDIARTFRGDTFAAWKERLIESGGAGLTDTHYHQFELEDLKEYYYFLRAEQVLYDSGAIGGGDDYQSSPFYQFFIEKLNLGVHQDTLRKPVSFSSGALIVLNAVYSGF